MKHNIFGVGTLALPLTIALFTATASAATIVFSPGQTISGDSDVSTNGSLMYAFTESGLATTVNGVSFAAGSSNLTLGGGSITLGGFDSLANNVFTSAIAPYSGLSSAYQQTLQGAAFDGNVGVASITLHNLTIGQQYEVQVWTQDPRFGPTSVRTQFVRNLGSLSGQVEIDFNSTNGDGGVGQFTIGTFTADATIQAFEMNASAGGFEQINAIQLRAVPEPSHVALLGLASVAFLMCRRR